jgi:hypothetical protein
VSYHLDALGKDSRTTRAFLGGYGWVGRAQPTSPTPRKQTPKRLASGRLTNIANSLHQPRLQ